MRTAEAWKRITRSVLVFLKWPEPGRVKTRLASTLGPERAAALYRHWVGVILGHLQPIRSATRLVGYFEGAPEEAFRDWLALADDWWPQPSGDLGERLVAGFARAFHLGGPVLAVGTDCLEIDAGLLLQAFEQLSHRDVVFGPTPDGGYYLIGLSVARPELFRSIRWSSPFALDDHLRCCREERWSVSLLSMRHDIDTENDWHSYLQRTGQSRSSTTDNLGGRDSNAERGGDTAEVARISTRPIETG
jgi:rSAM/selenodomain-associated transferase 1